MAAEVETMFYNKGETLAWSGGKGGKCTFIKGCTYSSRS